jgi:anti-sigma-K factor RskA
MTLQPHDSYEDLLAAYALDAVDDDERTLVDRRLAGDGAMRRELAGYHELLAVLAEAVESSPSTPSPSVWDGIERSISGTRSVPAAPEFTPSSEIKRRRFTMRFLGLVAAGSLVAATVFGVQLATLEEPGLAAAAEELRVDPTSSVLRLTASGGLAVEVVLGSDGTGYVFTDELPQITTDRTYQLWAINTNGVISAGIFDRNGVAAFHVDGPVAGLAITEEIAGGVVTSENDPVAVWLEA